jgi:hypothetical protein
MGHSITYRIAVGLQQGRKVFTLLTIPVQPNEPPSSQWVGKVKVIACIEDTLIIHKILIHLGNHSKSENTIPFVMPEPSARLK